MSDGAVGETSQSLEDDRIPEEEFLRDRPRTQLRLHHLFALTTVMAVLLTIAGQPPQFAKSTIEMPPAVKTFQAVFTALQQIPAAVAITALGYGIAAYRRGELFFNQPGHWLLVEVSLMSLLSLPVAIIFRLLPFDSKTAPGDAFMIWMMVFGIYSLFVLFLGRILINVYLGSRKCRQTRWKRVFYCKAASTVLSLIGEILVLAFLIMAIRKDRQERLLRNAGHWCGVYVQFAHTLLMLAGGAVGIIGMLVVFLWR
jgi:hypothetical protein